jgi:hypothetical protein
MRTIHSISLLSTIALVVIVSAANAQRLQAISVDFPSSEQVLAMAARDNSHSFDANYDLAVHYYNRGVQVVQNTPDGENTRPTIAMQNEIAGFFRKALPYAKTAHMANPGHPETLKMLSGIYFGLNDQALSKYYQELYQRNQR